MWSLVLGGILIWLGLRSPDSATSGQLLLIGAAWVFIAILQGLGEFFDDIAAQHRERKRSPDGMVEGATKLVIVLIAIPICGYIAYRFANLTTAAVVGGSVLLLYLCDLALGSIGVLVAGAAVIALYFLLPEFSLLIGVLAGDAFLSIYLILRRIGILTQ